MVPKWLPLYLKLTILKIVVLQGKFNCTECYKGFYKEKDLDGHIIRNHKSILLKCNLCPREFARQEILEKHIERNHSEEKSFQSR
jgi:hypothetical protein